MATPAVNNAHRHPWAPSAQSPPPNSSRSDTPPLYSSSSGGPALPCDGAYCKALRGPLRVNKGTH